MTKRQARFIILASASSRRRKLLKKIFPVFKIAASGIREPKPNLRRFSPTQYVKHAARLKATKVAKRFRGKNALVIGADTIVYAQGQIIGKPANRKDARRIMQTLSGTRHQVITGVCIIDTTTGQSLSGHETSIIRMKRVSSATINQITSAKRHLDKAGGYAIQESGDKHVRLIKGSMSNAVGLPLRLVRRLTQRLKT